VLALPCGGVCYTLWVARVCLDCGPMVCLLGPIGTILMPMCRVVGNGLCPKRCLLDVGALLVLAANSADPVLRADVPCVVFKLVCVCPGQGPLRAPLSASSYTDLGALDTPLRNVAQSGSQAKLA
jgi:hypothetical protein